MKLQASTLSLVVAIVFSLSAEVRSQALENQPPLNPLTGLPARVISTSASPDDPQSRKPERESAMVAASGLPPTLGTNSASESAQFYRLVVMSKTDPEIRKTLIAIRDKETREFSAKGGSFALFHRIYDANHALGDDAASYSLFQGITKTNQNLAGACYFVMEPLLARRGEYRRCLEYIGNPETRFEIYLSTYQRFAPVWEGLSGQAKERNRKLEAFRRAPGRPPMPSFPQNDSGTFGLTLSRKRFIRDVCLLIEILVGTDHEEVAEKIRGEAIAALNDPQIQTSVSHAREHLKHRDTTPSAGEPEEASAAATNEVATLINRGTGPNTISRPPGLVVSGEIDPQTGLPGARQSGVPTGSADQNALDSVYADAARFQNTVNASLDKSAGWPVIEIGALISNGRYDEAQKSLHEIEKRPREPATLAGIFSMWCDLARKFPPARQDLIEIRDHALRQFGSDQGSPGLFVEVEKINHFLGQDDATTSLFQQIHERTPQLARTYYSYAQTALMQNHAYGLCLRYCGDPQTRFDSFRTNLIFMRKVVSQGQRAREVSRREIEAMETEARLARQEQERKNQERQDELEKSIERQRQEAWTKALASMPGQSNGAPLPPPVFRRGYPLPKPPLRLERSAIQPAGMDMGVVITNNFVGDVRKLVEILAGAGRLADAEKIRDEAVALLDDPRLLSAVTDAQAKINKRADGR